MTAKFKSRSIYTALIVFVAFILSACGGQEPKLEPWKSTALNQIDFDFEDTDMDKGEIAGDLTLNLPSSLVPAQAKSYIVYWGGGTSSAARGQKLTEVSVNISGNLLYRVPENTPIPASDNSYFLLFLADAAGKEVFSGKYTPVEDNVVVEEEPEKKEEPAKVTEEEPEQVTEEKPKEEETVDVPVATPAPEVEMPEAVEPETPEVEAETEAKVEAEEFVKPEQPEQIEKPEQPEPVEQVEQEPVKTEKVEPKAEEPAETVPVVIVIRNVLYEFDRSYLRPDYKRQLREDFADLDDKIEVELLVAGHADERGSNEYNLALGERRAYSVKRYLVSLGFDADNIRIISYGEEKPVDPRHNEEAWRKNRRAETKILER